VVDNDKDVCDFTVRFFEERNFEISSATSGKDALQAIKKYRPDIVLLEIDLKDIRGAEILRRIRIINRSTTIIIVSGIDDLEIIDKAKRWGAIAYLTKPILLNELMDTVLRHLGREHRFFELKRMPRNV
jgi:DNA-binding response OmpR family regulator